MCSAARTGAVLDNLVAKLRRRDRIQRREDDGWEMLQSGKTGGPIECPFRTDSDDAPAAEQGAAAALGGCGCERCSHVGAEGCAFGYERCSHIKRLKDEVMKKDREGWHHWDKLDRFFGIWMSGADERGGDDDPARAGAAARAPAAPRTTRAGAGAGARPRRVRGSRPFALIG